VPCFSRFYSSALKHIGLFSKILFGSNTFTEDRKNKHMKKLEINILLHCSHRCSHVTPTAGILTCVSISQPLQAQGWVAHNIKITYIILNLLSSCSSPLSSAYYYSSSSPHGSRGSAVGIATGYGLDDRPVGFRVPVGARIFSFPCRADQFWGPSSLLSDGYRGLHSPGLKGSGREADHSPPTSADVKKT
jgi:hypothetical protein